MTPADVFHRAHGFVRAYDLRYVDCFAVDGVLELIRIHETQDPHVIVAELDVVGSLGGTNDKPFTLSFIHVIEVIDDHIVMQRDYFDSLEMAERLRVS